MYIPRHFEENRTAVLHELIRTRPLATLVTLGEGGLNANHIPLLLDTSAGGLGRLQGHVPRANPLTSNRIGDVEALAVFHGPEAYISPGWYATKRETGKVVPTWNYAVAHVYGRLEIIDDAAWVRSQAERLTAQQEAGFAQPWQVSDAPRDYTDRMIAALVGIEIEITRLLGKVKASQNQPEKNRAGVISGLNALGDPRAAELAALVEAEE